MNAMDWENNQSESDQDDWETQSWFLKDVSNISNGKVKTADNINEDNKEGVTEKLECSNMLCSSGEGDSSIESGTKATMETDNEIQYDLQQKNFSMSKKEKQ